MYIKYLYIYTFFFSIYSILFNKAPRYYTTTVSETTTKVTQPVVKDFIKVSHPTTRVTAYNEKLAIALRKRSIYKALDEVQSIIKEIKQEGIKFDALTYNALLIAYTRAKKTDEALNTLTDMINEGHQPTNESFNIVLSAFIHRNGIPLQEKVLDLMKQQNVPYTAITYQYIIECLSRNDKLNTALKTLEEMKKEKIQPTLLTYGSLIHSCLFENEPKIAFDLLKEAQDANLPVETDPRILMDVMRVCSLNDNVEQTQYCWNKIVSEHGIRPDEGTCLQVLRVAGLSGDTKLASEVIGQLSNNGYPYKEHYFVPLMEAFLVKDDIKSVFNVLDIMRASGVDPSMKSTIPISLKLSKDIDSIDKAYYLLEDLHKEGKRIDITAFNILVTACGLAKDIGRTVATYREAKNLGITPNVDTFNAVLDACIKTEMKGMGNVVIEELKKAEVKPNVDTFTKMITLACTQKNYEDAFVYLEEMKSYGVIPPESCYVVIARKLAFERDPRFHIALEEMETYGYPRSLYLKSLWK
ncbi:unnamed protein product [Cunninghamella blakesleeana]